MLSILIPTYNYNIYPLVMELKSQADVLDIAYEILVQDDASTYFLEENSKINELKNCSFEKNNNNLGRSKIRNLLSHKAKFNWLLFLDSDTRIKKANFLKKYLQYATDSKIVYGGIRYQKQIPESNKILRWVYGKKREALTVSQRNKNKYLSFLTLNFLISKDVFSKVQFNENIPNLRHEDTLFSFELFTNKIPILHIKNPVIHNGLDDNIFFLVKSRESIEGLLFLLENNLIDYNYTKLSKWAKKISNLKLSFLIVLFFKILKPYIELNLVSKKPNLLLYDIYRLGYFCSLKKNKSV